MNALNCFTPYTPLPATRMPPQPFGGALRILGMRDDYSFARRRLPVIVGRTASRLVLRRAACLAAPAPSGTGARSLAQPSSRRAAACRGDDRRPLATAPPPASAAGTCSGRSRGDDPAHGFAAADAASSPRPSPPPWSPVLFVSRSLPQSIAGVGDLGDPHAMLASASARDGGSPCGSSAPVSDHLRPAPPAPADFLVRPELSQPSPRRQRFAPRQWRACVASSCLSLRGHRLRVGGCDQSGRAFWAAGRPRSGVAARSDAWGCACRLGAVRQRRAFDRAPLPCPTVEPWLCESAIKRRIARG